VGSMTGSLVYSRLIAQHFERAQGLALTVMNSAPAVLAIPVVPLLNLGIEHYGLRAAYLGLGLLVLVLSLVAVGLTEPHRVEIQDGQSSPPPKPKAARDDYSIILKSHIFWLITIAMFLCLLQTQLHSSQMNLMLIDQGLTKQIAANTTPIYLAGTIIGRILCGVALDHYSTRLVTAISMGIPALGFMLLASSFDSYSVIALALFIVGLSVGAESDLICFLVARYFKLRIYGTTFGLVHCVSFLASAGGGVAVSFTLARYDSFTPFLWVIAGAITIGALLFLLLPREGRFEKVG
jgi:sugar phosphate permease